MPKSFVFLGDLIDTDGKKTIKLADNYILKKANKIQVVAIKNSLDHFIDSFNSKVNKYEHRIVKEKKNTNTFYLLEKEDWNYWIIQNSNFQLDKDFALALQLCQLDLTIILEGIYPTKINYPGISINHLAISNYYIDDSINDFHYKKVTPKIVNEIRKIVFLLEDLDRKKYYFIEKALDDFDNLHNISKQSPFKVIGYISILELLLTTHRSSSPNISSLNHQLSKKIKLLTNQFEERINISDFFKGPKSNTVETIVNLLYKYRNDIAHGNISDFEKKLKLLKNQRDNILVFLKIVVKKILRFAIEYPQLVSDLKEC